MQTEVIDGYEVSSDGRRVWVNSLTTCASVARFSVFGELVMVDVHNEPHLQAERGECLDCCNGSDLEKLWAHFKEALEKHYGIQVPDRHKPRRNDGGCRLRNQGAVR